MYWTKKDIEELLNDLDNNGSYTCKRAAGLIRYLDSQLNAKELEHSDEVKEMAQKSISRLNENLGTDFKATTAETVKKISARYRDGYRLEDFILVIDSKCEEWKNDKKFRQYLNPQTLFQPSKFEKYLQEAKKNPIKTGIDWSEV